MGEKGKGKGYPESNTKEMGKKNDKNIRRDCKEVQAMGGMLGKEKK